MNLSRAASLLEIHICVVLFTNEFRRRNCRVSRRRLQEMNHWLGWIPDVVWVKLCIEHQFSPEDLLAMTKTCKHFHRIDNDPSIWKQFLHQEQDDYKVSVGS